MGDEAIDSLDELMNAALVLLLRDARRELKDFEDQLRKVDAVSYDIFPADGHLALSVRLRGEVGLNSAEWAHSELVRLEAAKHPAIDAALQSVCALVTQEAETRGARSTSTRMLQAGARVLLQQGPPVLERLGARPRLTWIVTDPDEEAPINLCAKQPTTKKKKAAQKKVAKKKGAQKKVAKKKGAQKKKTR